MPAQAGIQGKEEIDTGFRRYDRILMPIAPQILCAHVFSKETRDYEVRN